MPPGGSPSPGTLPVAVLVVVVMSLLVLGVAGVVLRDGLRDGTIQRATTGTRRGRARPDPSPPRPSPRPTRPTTAARRHDRRPVRSGVALLASSAGIGLLLAAVVGGGLLVVLAMLRSAVDA